MPNFLSYADCLKVDNTFVLLERFVGEEQEQ